MNRIVYLIGCALLGILAGWLCDEKDALIVFLVMLIVIVIIAFVNLLNMHLFAKSEKKGKQEIKNQLKLCDGCDNYSFPFEGCQMCDGEDFYRPKEVKQ